jgi:predicted NUDIX family NTP pyrophosphohydrolase
VLAWAVRGDLDPEGITSNTFEVEWPPRSGKRSTFPEVDRAAWFSPEAAMRALVRAQAAFVERLVALGGT